MINMVTIRTPSAEADQMNADDCHQGVEALRMLTGVVAAVGLEMVATPSDTVAAGSELAVSVWICGVVAGATVFAAALAATVA